jgi:hypothetical protein
MWLRRALRLDNASWLFFVFFSQDNIFMALALDLREEVAVVCAGSGARARQLIKRWASCNLPTYWTRGRGRFIIIVLQFSFLKGWISKNLFC